VQEAQGWLSELTWQSPFTKSDVASNAAREVSGGGEHFVTVGTVCQLVAWLHIFSDTAPHVRLAASPHVLVINVMS
jgi:hypothetical protein